MQFSFSKAAVATLAVGSNSVFAALTAQQMVDNIHQLTTKSQALQAPAKSITLVNAPLIIIGQGPFPQLIVGFTDIVTTATTAIAQMQGTPPITDSASADSIFDAFRSFVRVHQDLLNILIGKAGILTKVPFVGEPVATVLRGVESVVDTIAHGLIDTVQARSADLQKEANSLSSTIETAINSYSGLMITKRADSNSNTGSFRHFRA